MGYWKWLYGGIIGRLTVKPIFLLVLTGAIALAVGFAFIAMNTLDIIAQTPMEFRLYFHPAYYLVFVYGFFAFTYGIYLGAEK